MDAIKFHNYTVKFTDFKVVDTGFLFTWVKLKYEIYNENNELIDNDWTYYNYGTYGYDTSDLYYDEETDEEIELADEDVIEMVDDMFHEGYELEDIIDGISRSGDGQYFNRDIHSVEDILSDEHCAYRTCQGTALQYLLIR